MRACLPPLLYTVLGLLFAAYCFVFFNSGLSFETAADRFYLFFVGIFAATIANSTGMGGGVVFLPAFEFISSHGLPLTAAQIIGMSFVIQSFGMTMGSSRWLLKAYGGLSVKTGVAEEDFWRIIRLVLLTAIPSLLLTQYALHLDKDWVLMIFKAFSIALGLKLFIATVMTHTHGQRRTHVTPFDKNMLLTAGALGGCATALFSVGVGEFVALYLFIRNFPLVTCAATAVILSALTVLIGLPWHLYHTALPWDFLALTIPGALIGGFLARQFAYKLGNRRLKYLAALWITLSSLFLLLR